MSLLNKQNVKALALDLAETYHPDKTRISGDFIAQLEDLVGCIVVHQVCSQALKGKTLNSTDWGDAAIRQAQMKFTTIETSRYLRNA